jgi:hypothetical protein
MASSHPGRQIIRWVITIPFARFSPDTGGQIWKKAGRTAISGRDAVKKAKNCDFAAETLRDRTCEIYKS